MKMNHGCLLQVRAARAAPCSAVEFIHFGQGDNLARQITHGHAVITTGQQAKRDRKAAYMARLACLVCPACVKNCILCFALADLAFKKTYVVHSAPLLFVDSVNEV